MILGRPRPSPHGRVRGLAASYNKLGHHGLFADRLDANYQGATLAAGFVSSTHLPARIVYNVRNRTYDPSTQRWLQRDPNATGQVVLGSLANGGRAMSGAVSAVELTTLYGDEMSLYGYVENGPVLAKDALGLETAVGQLSVMGAMGEMFGIFGGGIGAMIKQFLFAGATVGVAGAHAGAFGYAIYNWATGNHPDVAAGGNYGDDFIPPSENPFRNWELPPDDDGPPREVPIRSLVGKLTKSQIKSLEDRGYRIHDLKAAKSDFDLYRDANGYVYRGLKSGRGMGEYVDVRLGDS